MMKLILKQTIEKLGKVGDTVTVKNGYGRNYLIPQGLAVAANTPNLQALEHELHDSLEKLRRLHDDAAGLAGRLAEVTCRFTRKAGDNERLFGSVTSMDIAAALEAQGFDIDRRKIELEEPIKALGQSQVPIKLHSEVTASVRVVVEPEEAAGGEAPSS